MEDLLKQPYFHGDLGTTEADSLLSKQADKKTFLVRFSSRDPGCYAISTLSENNKVKHYRVYHKPGMKFLIGKTEVGSLQEIVTKFGKDLELIYPCAGSPYEKIFVHPMDKSKLSISEGYQVPDFN
jgi:hypothetical protein